MIIEPKHVELFLQLIYSTFNFGTLFVEIFPSGEGLVINILDTSTGDQSQVIIPN